MDPMNEDTVRILLADAADAPEPASVMSLEAARKAGRRRQWTARVTVSGAAAVVAAAAALVVPHIRIAAPASATSPSSAARATARIKPAAAAPAPAPAPARFDPLSVTANFGWLPSFWNEQQASITVTQHLTDVNLKDGQTLKVSPRGWYPDPDINPNAGNFQADEGAFPAKTFPKAPAVNGQPAYWVGGGIMWEYAPGAWAYLYGAGNTATPVGQSLVEKMAKGVRFGQQRPLYTPFQFARRLPAGWQLTETDSIVTNGRALLWQITAGPAASPNALTITNDPKNLGTRCGIAEPSAQQSALTVDGIAMVSYYASGAGPNGYQSLCSTTPVNNGGYLSMYYYWRDHNQAFNLASLARSMKFLGHDPAAWTTDPFGG